MVLDDYKFLAADLANSSFFICSHQFLVNRYQKKYSKPCQLGDHYFSSGRRLRGRFNYDGLPTLHIVLHNSPVLEMLNQQIPATR